MELFDYLKLVSSSIVCFALVVLIVNFKFLVNSFKICLLGTTMRKRVLVATIVPFTILLLPFILVVVTLFWFFREILGAFFKFKYGPDFGGFLNNGDVIWMYDEISKPIIMSCLIVDFDGPFKEFLQKIRKRLEERVFSGKYQKMTCIRQKFFGYTFLLENQVNVDDCLYTYHCQEEVVNQKYLHRIFGNIANRPMPKNDTGFWELVVINKPVIWSGKDNDKKYCVILRLQHGLCDGISAHKIVVGCLSDEDQQVSVEEEPQIDIRRELFRYYRYVTAWCFLLPLATIMSFTTTLETFPKRPTGRKICLCSVEETPKYISKVKSIKKSLVGISFSEIVMAGLFTSFFENILQGITPVTDFVNISISGTRYLNNFPRYHHGLKDTYVLNNDLTCFTFVWFPTLLNQQLSRLQKLKEIHKRYDLIKESLDSEVLYWTIVILSLIFPNYTIRALCENVPGLQNMKVFGGCEVVDVFGFSPNFCEMNLSFCVNTYDGRFQIALVGDQRLIADEEQGRKILDGAFKYLDDLSKELGLE